MREIDHEAIRQDVETITREVHALLAELKTIGHADPNVGNEHYKAFLGADRARTREIGQRLYDIGGFEMMQAAHESVRRHLPNAGPLHLSFAWKGIGDWQP